MILPENNSVVKEIIKFSKENEKIIREEFKKLVDYYSNNQRELMDNMLEIKATTTEDDYYSNVNYDGAEDIMNNAEDVSERRLDETLLLDSMDKINRQIRRLPNEVKESDETVKIFFYDLAEKSLDSGTRIVISTVILPWKIFTESFQAISN